MHASPTPTSAPVRQRPLLALGLRLLAAAVISALFMLVKLADQRGVSLAESLFWRQLIPAIALGGYLAATGQLGRLRTRRMPVHVRRAAFGLVGMVFNLGAVLLLPMTEATVLGFTSPIFAVMLAAIFLGERVGPVRWLAVALGLAGVAIIAGPDRSAIPLDGLLVGIGAAFMVALVAIQVRDLGQTEEPIATVFWFSLLCVPVLLPAMLWVRVPHAALDWAMLLGIGVLGLFGQLLLTWSLRVGSVSSVIVMDYSSFGWAMVWGWLVFDHLPPAATWIGAPVIVAAGLIIVWREHRLHIEKSAAPLGA